MTIPRLDPSANSFTIGEIIINKRLRPYFEKWYLDNKRENETPEEFIFRNAKDDAIGYHLNDIGYDIKQEMQDAAYTAESDSKADHDLLITEVD